MFKKLAAVTAVVLGSVAAPVLVAQTAAAAPTDSGKFCSIRAETQKMVCVATEAELPQARAQAAGTTTSARGDVTPMAVVIVGKLYDNAGYDESAGYLEVQSGALCTSSRTDVNVSLGTLGGWDNRISSFRGFGNCGVKLFENTYFGGSAYPGSGFYTQSSNVGVAMNDRASSVQFS